MSNVIGSIDINVSAEVAAAIRSLTQVEKKLDETGKKTGEVAKQAEVMNKRFTSAISSIGNGFAARIGHVESFARALLLPTGALALLGKTGLSTAAELETAEKGFQTLLGSAKAAAEAVDMIKKDAAQTPFELTGLINANLLLTTVTKNAKVSERSLLNIGKALAASGKGQAELDRIILNLQQIGLTGKVTEMDIRQFGYNGINVLELLGEYYGVTAAEAGEMSKNSSDAFGDLMKAFNKAGEDGGRFADSFINNAGTFNQIFSNLTDNFTVGMAEIAKQSGLFDLVKSAAQQLTGWLEKLTTVQPDLAKKILNVTLAVVGSVAAFVALMGIIKLVILFTNPLMLLLAALAALLGYVLYKALERTTEGMETTAKSSEELGESMEEGAEKGGGAVRKLADETIEKLADIDKQMVRTTRDYLRSLADIVWGHKEAVKNIESDEAKLTESFKDASATRLADYEADLAKISEKHNEKTQSIQDDINAEMAKGRKANLYRVAELQASLNKEKSAYEDNKREIDKKYAETTEKATAEYEKRKSELQLRLGEEKAFLEKHNAEVAQVQNVARMDEIEKLKEKYSEQMAQYELDKRAAIKADIEKNGALITGSKTVQQQFETSAAAMTKAISGITDGVNIDAFKSMGDVMGGEMGAKFIESLKLTVKDMWSSFTASLIPLMKHIPGIGTILRLSSLYGYVSSGMDLGNAIKASAKDLGGSGELDRSLFTGLIPGFATGVSNFAGGLAVVGERGPELMRLGKGTSVYSNAQSRVMTEGMGGQTTVNINAGAFVGTPAEARRFAAQIGEELQGIKVIRGGVPG